MRTQEGDQLVHFPPLFFFYSFTGSHIFISAVDLVELEEALIVIHRHLYIKLQDIEEVLNTNKKAHQTDDGSVQSEMATKMTDGSSLIHSHSIFLLQ